MRWELHRPVERTRTRSCGVRRSCAYGAEGVRTVVLLDEVVRNTRFGGGIENSGYVHLPCPDLLVRRQGNRRDVEPGPHSLTSPVFQMHRSDTS